jgi:hypothetical protein
MGKSALMAKAIEQTEDTHKYKKVVYRFVGSKADLSTSTNVVLSILKELGLNSDELKIQTIRDSKGRDEEEGLEEYFYRLQQHFLAIKEEVIIFIDAVDQFTNIDALKNGHEFKWLPYKLPPNLKIVISALDDEKYKTASKYLKQVKTRVHSQGNLHELRPFSRSQSQTMLCNILAKSGRTINKDQEAYVLKQPDANLPLYLFVASQELIHWKSTYITKVYQSTDDGHDLAPTQQGIIGEYIRNLTEIYHHDSGLVHRVFSYLNLTNGLSESELLEILSMDQDFVKNIAPDTYHANTTKTLPVVIWARLHSHIKPFLKLESKDGQDTMSFFHREFNDSMRGEHNTQAMHNNLMVIIVGLMERHKDNSFESNRYGKLCVTVVTDYYWQYLADDGARVMDEYAEKISSVSSSSYLYLLTKWILEEKNESVVKLTLSYDFLRNRCEGDDKLIEVFAEVCLKLASWLRESGANEVHGILLTFAKVMQAAFVKNHKKWLALYIESVIEWSRLHSRTGDMKESLRNIEGAILAYKQVDFKSPETIRANFSSLIQAAYVNVMIRDYDNAIDLSTRALEIAMTNQMVHKLGFENECIYATTTLANTKSAAGHPIKDVIILREAAVAYSEGLFGTDSKKYFSIYANSLLDLAGTLSHGDYFTSAEYQPIKPLGYDGIDPAIVANLKKSTELALQARDILLPLLEKDPYSVAEVYSQSIFILIKNHMNTFQNNEAMVYSDNLLADVEHLKTLPVIDKIRMEVSYKKVLIFSRVGKIEEAYDLHYDIIQDNEDERARAKEGSHIDMVSVNNFIIYLMRGVEIFKEFDDWIMLREDIRLARDLCTQLFSMSPDAWISLYLDVSATYSEILFIHAGEPALAYEVAKEMKIIMINSEDYIGNEYPFIDQIIERVG